MCSNFQTVSMKTVIQDHDSGTEREFIFFLQSVGKVFQLFIDLVSFLFMKNFIIIGKCMYVRLYLFINLGIILWISSLSNYYNCLINCLLYLFFLSILILEFRISRCFHGKKNRKTHAKKNSSFAFFAKSKEDCSLVILKFCKIPLFSKVGLAFVNSTLFLFYKQCVSKVIQIVAYLFVKNLFV